MRSFVATLLGAGAALCVAGQALAQAPTPAPAAPVPDQMPFDIPYGPAITADRAAQVVPPRWRKQRSHRAIGNSQSRSSIQTAISSTSTRWIRRRWHRSAFPRARLARRRVTGGRPAPSSRSCRTRPAPIYPRSIRRLSPPPAGSRSSRAASSSAQSVAAAPPVTRTGWRARLVPIQSNNRRREHEMGPRRQCRGPLSFNPARIRSAAFSFDQAESGWRRGQRARAKPADRESRA